MKQLLMRMLARLDTFVNFVEKFVLAGSVLGMTGISIGNVIARNLFNHSLVFADEINQVFIVLITFIGIGYAARHGRHIRMSAFHDLLPATAKRLSMTIIAFSTAAILWLLGWYALQYVLHIAASQSVTPALQIPLYSFYLAAPIGLLLGGIQYLLAGIRNLFSDIAYVSFSKPDGYDAAPADIERSAP